MVRLLVCEVGHDGVMVRPALFTRRYRPSGSRHAAWTTEGGLMIAIFQVPNKFFEEGGKVVDLVGNDWGTKWGTWWPSGNAGVRCAHRQPTRPDP